MIYADDHIWTLGRSYSTCTRISPTLSAEVGMLYSRAEFLPENRRILSSQAASWTQNIYCVELLGSFFELTNL